MGILITITIAALVVALFWQSSVIRQTERERDNIRMDLSGKLGVAQANLLVEKDYSTRLVRQCQSQLHSAQAEIRELEDKLRGANHGN